MRTELEVMLDLPDCFNNEFAIKGWVFVGFACGVDPAKKALSLAQSSTTDIEVDNFLATELLNIEAIFWQASLKIGNLGGENERRAALAIIDRAFFDAD
jgi:hypothetical protein